MGIKVTPLAAEANTNPGGSQGPAPASTTASDHSPASVTEVEDLRQQLAAARTALTERDAALVETRAALAARDAIVASALRQLGEARAALRERDVVAESQRGPVAAAAAAAAALVAESPGPAAAAAESQPAPTPASIPASAMTSDEAPADLVPASAPPVESIPDERGHLRLGLTIKAMRDFVDALGTLEDAVAECNAAIPRRKDGSLKFPENGDFNGYGGFSFHAPKDNH